MEFINNLPDWIYGVVALVVVAGVVAGKKQSKKNKNAPPAKGRQAWMYIDDVVTEGNGPMDLLAVLGLATVYGPPILIGATQSKHGTGLTFTRNVSKKENGPIVFEGARRYGSNQGHSPLSSEIVKWAKQSGNLTVCVGGKWTDVAIALRKNPEIKDKLRVVAIGGSNKTNDQDAANFVKKSGCRLVVLERRDYGKLITGKKPAEANAWLNRHMRPKRAGADVLKDSWLRENIRNNAGQFGNATPIRMADCLSVLVAFEGWGILKDPARMYAIIEKGLAKLP